MAFVFRTITKRIFVICTIAIAGLFLLACCNAFLNSQIFWFLALLGLVFPFLLALLILSLILWLLARSRWALLPLVCLLLGYTNIRAMIAFNFSEEPTIKKTPGTLRILTWNVTSFDEQVRRDKRRKVYRNDMLSFIRSHNPDILCFQEYVEPNTDRVSYNNKHDFTAMGYPYHHIVYDYTNWKGTFLSGIAIYSKYPIIDSQHVRYPGPKNFRAGESLIGADIDVNGQTIRVLTTHLQSVVFRPNDYHNIQIIKSAADSLLDASKSVVKKLVQGYQFRGGQANIVRKVADQSPYPVVICGDFNDVPNSYTYFHIKGPRKDAFIQAGGGIGRTFANISPTLRIDYILPDPQFEVVQYNRVLVPYSEHYPVFADLALPDTGN